MTHVAVPSAADEAVLALGVRGQRARILIRTHHLRATAGRVAVLAALANAPEPGHLSAPELFEQIARDAIDIDRTSVYRTLTTLVGLDVVHQLAVGHHATSYGLAEHPHQHAVCDRCHRMTEIAACELAGALVQARRGSRFVLAETGSLTLHGLCPDCQNASPRHRRKG